MTSSWASWAGGWLWHGLTFGPKYLLATTLKKIVVLAVRRSVGSYVHGVDDENVTIGIQQGMLDLSNLRLRPEKICELIGLPVRMLDGRVGRLKVTIPWMNLFRDPIQVELENVYVLMETLTAQNFNKDLYEATLQSHKQTQLQKIEQMVLESQKDEATEKSEMTLWEQLVTKGLQCVEVKVSSLHCRYEHGSKQGSADPDHLDFALGVTIGKVDSKTLGDPVKSPTVFEKRVDLENLAVYWNTNARSFIGGIEEGMSCYLPGGNTSRSVRPDYILQPVSVSTQLALNLTAGQDLDVPKARVKILMKGVEICLKHSQLCGLSALVNHIRVAQDKQSFWKHRPGPGVTVKGNPRAWFKYAITAVLQETVRPGTISLELLKDRKKLADEYAAVYQMNLEQSTAALVKRVADMECKMDVSNIAQGRHRARMAVTKKKLLESERQAMSSMQPGYLPSWTTSWWYGSSNDDMLEDNGETLFAKVARLSERNKTELRQLLGLVDDSAFTADLPIDYVCDEFDFQLDRFRIRLVDSRLQDILVASMWDVGASLWQRPAANAWGVKYHLNDVSCVGKTSRGSKDLPPPAILAAKAISLDGKGLFHLQFETNPLDCKDDFKFTISLKPVQVFYDAATWKSVLQFLSLPDSRELNELTADLLILVSTRTSVSFNYLATNNKTLLLDVKLRSPIIVVPELGKLKGSSSVFVVDLGLFEVFSDPRRWDKSQRQKKDVAEVDDLFDFYHINVVDVQAFLSNEGENWATVVAPSVCLMPSFEVNLVAAIRLKGAPPSLPRLKVSGKISDLCFFLSESRTKQLFQLYANLPSPFPTVEASLASDDLVELALNHGIGIAMAASRHQWPEANLNKVQRRLSRVIEDKRRSAAESDRPVDQCLTHDDMKNMVFQLVKQNQSVISRNEHGTTSTDSSQVSTTGTGLWTNNGDDDEDDNDEDMFFDAVEVLEPKSSPASEIQQVVNIEDLTVAFTLEQITVLFLESSTDEKEYLRFQANKFACDLVQAHHTAFYSDGRQTISSYQRAKACVKSLVLEDLTTDRSGPVKLVDSTASEEQLITVSLQQADANCPVLASEFENTLQLVELNMADIKLAMHRESVSLIRDLVVQLLHHWNSIPASGYTQRGTPSPLSDVFSTKSQGPSPTHSQSQATHAAGGAKKYVLRSNLRQFSIELVGCHDYHLADMGVEHVTASLEVHDRKTVASCHLKALHVRQSAPDTIYPEICSIMRESGDLLDFKATMFDHSNRPPSEESDDSVDFEIAVKMRRLRVVYLHHFTSLLRNFLLDLSVMEHLARASEESSRIIAEEFSKPKAARIHLQALLQAPIVLLPRNSKSREVLLVCLGNVEVRNSLSKQTFLMKSKDLEPDNDALAADSSVLVSHSRHHGLHRSQGVDHDDSPLIPKTAVIPMDKITIRLKDFVLFRMMHSELSAESPRHLLTEPISLSINIDRSLQRESTIVPWFTASVRLESIQVHLNRMDYLLLSGVWYENLAESPQHVQSRVHRSATSTSSGHSGHSGRTSRTSTTSANSGLYILREEPEGSPLLSSRGIDRSSTSRSESKSGETKEAWKKYSVKLTFAGICTHFYIGEQALTNDRKGTVTRERPHCIATADIKDGSLVLTVLSTDELTAKFSLMDLYVVDKQAPAGHDGQQSVSKIIDRRRELHDGTSSIDELREPPRMVSIELCQPDTKYYTLKLYLNSVHCKLSINFMADIWSIFSGPKASDPLGVQAMASGGTSPLQSDADSEFEEPEVYENELIAGIKHTAVGKRADNITDWLEDVGVTYWCEVFIIDPDIWLVENPTRHDSPVLALEFEAEFLMIQSDECSKVALVMTDLHMESFLCGYWEETNVTVLRPCSLDFFYVPDTPSEPDTLSPSPSPRTSTISSSSGSSSSSGGKDTPDAYAAPPATVDKAWVRVSQLSLNISPALILTVQTIVFHTWDYIQQSEEFTDVLQEESAGEAMWEPRKINRELWMAEHGVHPQPAQILCRPKREKLYVDVDGIDVKFDILQGSSSYVPVLAMGVHVHDMEINDWSSRLSASLTAATEITYFNRSSAVWEPLLEPLEKSVPGVLRPWKVQLQYFPILNQPVWQGQPKLQTTPSMSGSSSSHARTPRHDEPDAVSHDHGGPVPRMMFLPGAGLFESRDSGSTDGRKSLDRDTLQTIDVVSGTGCPDSVGQVANCVLMSSSDLLSLTFSATSVELLFDIVTAYYNELGSHNTTVQAQVSCLDVPMRIQNELGLDMDIITFQERLDKPGTSKVNYQQVQPRETVRLSWPSHQPALTAFSQADGSGVTSPGVRQMQHRQRLQSANQWVIAAPEEETDGGPLSALYDRDEQFWDIATEWLILSAMEGSHEIREQALFSPHGAFQFGQPASGGDSFASWPILRAPESAGRPASRPPGAVPVLAEDAEEGETDDEVDGHMPAIQHAQQPRKGRLRKPAINRNQSVCVEIEHLSEETDGDLFDGENAIEDAAGNTRCLHRLWSRMPGHLSLSSAEETDGTAAADAGGEDEVDFPLHSLHKKPTFPGIESPGIDTKTCLATLLQFAHPLAGLASDVTATDGAVVNRQHPLAVEIEGFQVVQGVPLKRAGEYVLRLRPTNQHIWSRRKESYAMVCDVQSKEGQRVVTFRSMMQMKNHLDVELHVYCRPDLSKGMENIEELEQSIRSDLQVLDRLYDKRSGTSLLRIGTMKPGASFSVPLFVLYEWELFLGPLSSLGFSFSSEGLTPLSLATNRQSFIKCPQLGSESSDTSAFYFKVCVDAPDSAGNNVANSSVLQGQRIPRQILHFHPPAILRNLLPVDVHYRIEGVSVSSVELQAGKQDCLYTNRLNAATIVLEIPAYRAKKWIARIADIHVPSASTSTSHPPRTMPMKFKSADNQDKMYLAVDLTYDASIVIQLYAPYWLVNKTAVPVQWKAIKPGTGLRSEEEVIFQPTATGAVHLPSTQAVSSHWAATSGAAAEAGEPILFSFGKKSLAKGKMFVRADLDQSGWSKHIALETVGSGGVVVSKSRGTCYEFWLAIKAASCGLTKIVTISPHLVISNHTKVDLKCADTDRTGVGNATLQWKDVPAGKDSPFWPQRHGSGHMIIKPTLGFNTSLPFSFRQPLHHVLRMDIQDMPAICVEVRKSEQAERVVISEYYQGAAAVRLENWCQAAVICFNQAGHTQQMFLLPGLSQLYTWADPAGERRLRWWCGGQHTRSGDSTDGLPVLVHENVLHQNGMGTFSFVETPIDEPSNMFPVAAPATKRTRSVSPSRHAQHQGYWLSFLDGFQRVLLFTDKMATRERIRKMVSDQKATLQLYLALNSIQVSLVDDTPRELALISLTSGQHFWQVAKTTTPVHAKPAGGPSWSALPVDLACALEAAYQANMDGVSCELGSHQLIANLEAMYITSPFHGRLQRCSTPALWMQYAQSSQAMSTRLLLNRVQIDDQVSGSPAVSPLPESSTSGSQPFLEVLVSIQQASSQAVRHVKCAELILRDTRTKINLGFLVGLAFMLWPDLQDGQFGPDSGFRQDVDAVRNPIDYAGGQTLDVERILFSHLAIAAFKVQLHMCLQESDTMTATEKLRLNRLQNTLLSIGGLFLDDKTVTLDLDSFLVENSRSGMSQIYADVMDHYYSEGLRQWYKFVFGLDVLRRPASQSFSVQRGAGQHDSEASGYRTVESLVRQMLHLEHGASPGHRRRMSVEDDVTSYVQRRHSNVSEHSLLVCRQVHSGRSLIEILTDVFSSLGNWTEKGWQAAARQALSQISDGLSAFLAQHHGSVADVLAIATSHLLGAVDCGHLTPYPQRLARHISLDGVLQVYLHQPSYGRCILKALKTSGSLPSGLLNGDHVYMTHGWTDGNRILVVTQWSLLWVERQSSGHHSSWSMPENCSLHSLVSEPVVQGAVVSCTLEGFGDKLLIKAHNLHHARMICNEIGSARLYFQRVRDSLL